MNLANFKAIHYDKTKMRISLGQKRPPKTAAPKAPNVVEKVVPKAKPAPVDKNKRKIFIGLFFIVLAFIGVVMIFYIMMNMSRLSEQEKENLKVQVQSLDAEKGLAETKISDLEQQVAKMPDLDKIVATAGKIYGDKEKNRKEGFLWIDRQGEAMIATLGALNGLTLDSRLVVYDGDQKIGFVKVDLPMDVISYVLPDKGMKLSDFKKDYYRLVKE